MPPLNVLIKPASGSCNLSCRYCFYDDETERRSIKSYGIMPIETLDTIIKKGMAYAERTAVFGFQGGEPTLAGLDFFKAVVALEKKYNAKRLKISNSIQTNGVVIDDVWASFLHNEDFLTGVSLDGFQALHDTHRLDHAGSGSFYRVMRGIEALKKHEARFNILTVVTADTARYPEKLYRFFKKNDLLYQQYIPCLDPLEATRGSHGHSLRPSQYASFFTSLFDLWYDDVVNGRFIYIRYFENLFGIICGHPPEHCGMSGSCVIQNVIEADGSVFPCDFYATDAYYLGNLIDADFHEIAERNRAAEFIIASKTQDITCVHCQWFTVCRGGCRRDRDVDGNLQLNYFCDAFKQFFSHAVPKLINLRRIKRM